MPAPVPIEYRDFWDLPRMFLARQGGRLFLFDNPFDAEIEDYGMDYKVYLMPELSEQERQGSWTEFPQRALSYLCSIPLRSVRFADSEMRSVEAAFLAELAREPAKLIG